MSTSEAAMPPTTNKRLLIIIPAYNEEESIAAVLDAIHSQAPSADILVINDGSQDNTADLARRNGATVISLPYNLGIGSAMQTGYIYARNNDYNYAMQVDGDGQHDADQITLLLTALQTSEADVVIGSRFIEPKGYRPPPMRRIGITILSWLLSTLTKTNITDPTSGFRVCNKRAIAFFAHDYPFDYPEPEAIITMHRAGIHVKEVPVSMKPRQGGRSSITPFRSAYYMIKVIMAILLNMLRERPEANHA